MALPSPFAGILPQSSAEMIAQATRIASAGPLADAALAIEHHLAGVDEVEYFSAQQRLRQIESDYDQSFSNSNPASLPIDRLLSFMTTTQFLPHHIRPTEQPLLLTDFLTGRPCHPYLEGGSCLIYSMLAAHLGSRNGISLQFLVQIDHVNIYHQESDRAIDLAQRPHWIGSVDSLREKGDYGANQSPAPAIAALATLLLNIETSDETNFVDAALALYPDIPLALVARSLLEKDPHEVEKLLLKALSIHPRYLKALELLEKLYRKTRRFEEGGEVYRQILREELRRTTGSHED